MSKRLFPTDDKKAEPASDTLLRLAQEYETAFGRANLHHFLQQQVRDDDLRPGDIHTRLLKLPWRDVFTTNWDTLLERARDSVIDRPYSVVRNKDEIPLASQRRIIKLHGSLPAHFPLIFTEEDYRTYPTAFAPFVNTVQQAMMETVFCLIGFSGDDPNFLHWSGWVRDNLGTSAPKIYLAGYLGLSPHRRRMLEDRDVVPIDLAGHPRADKWPEHLWHNYATEWILYTLEYGRPYDVTDWPSPRRRQYSLIPEDLQPVVEATSDEPKCEPKTPPPDSEDLLGFVRTTIEVWSHNRSIYPGWLVVPAREQHQLHQVTGEWEPLILKALPDLSPLQQLNAIRELVWRREVLLDPISPELESAAEETIELIDCQNRTIDSVADLGVDWGDIREAWRAVALALVTVARHHFDCDLFNQRIEDLSPFLNDNPDVAHRIHHEHCLWAIYSMDFESLEGLLKGWQTENCDPVWMMRKAAILSEANRFDDANELSKRALSAIRQPTTDTRSVTRSSQESWALWSALSVENWHEFRKRWDELTPLKCNAYLEKQHIANAIKGDKANRDAPSFDLRRRRRTLRIPSHAYKYSLWVAARRAIRLSEVAGLPPFTEHMNVAADILGVAADELSASEPDMASRLVLRTSTLNKDSPLERVLSRTRVAMMPAGLAKTLVEMCKGVIEYALPQMFDEGTDALSWTQSWPRRMGVAMEALSRFVLRLKPDLVEVIFDKALEYYRNEQIARDYQLASPLRNILERTWEALPEERQVTRILDLLSAPIVGLDGFRDPEPFSRYPDPGDLLQDKNTLPRPDRTSSNESQWQEIVRRLIRGLEAGGAARERASRRLIPVAFWKQLTEDESLRVAQALWSEMYTGPDDLPGGTRFLDWVLLLFPELELGLAEQLFRRKWLAANNVSQEKEPSLDDILLQVGFAISGLKDYQHPLDLSADESYLTEVVDKWSDTPVPSTYPPPFYGPQEQTRWALNGLSSVLARIAIPKDVGEKLFEKLQRLNESDIPGFELIPGLAKAIPHRLDELVLEMRMGLVSNNAKLATSALQGLCYWMGLSGERQAQVEPPPDNVVREIGVIIATRRKASLEEALGVAKWVFDYGSDAYKENIAELTLQGLGYLAEELRYDRAHDQGSIDAVPRLRWRCAQLVSSMEKHGYKNHPVVAHWLQIIKEDPLPEVRYARSPVLTRQPEKGESVDGGLDSHTK
ncbi:MAG: SIR2 family protein [Truepera sp.]|nr:SIR2 family protein [Truepera sp.]